MVWSMLLAAKKILAELKSSPANGTIPLGRK